MEHHQLFLFSKASLTLSILDFWLQGDSELSTILVWCLPFDLYWYISMHMTLSC